MMRRWREKRQSLGLSTDPHSVPISDILKCSPRFAPMTEEQRAEAAKSKHEELIREQQRERDRIRGEFADVVRRVGWRYKGCTLENFQATDKPQQIALSRAKRFAGLIDEHTNDGRGVVLFGPPGTGKDHLIVGLLRVAALDHRFKVEWMNGLDFYGEMRDRIGTNAPEESLLDRYASAKILAISDPLPPSGDLGQFQQSTMFRLIDRRYRNRLATWVTVNVSSGEEMEQRMGAAFTDRLRDGALCIYCNWESFRKPQQ